MLFFSDRLQMSRKRGKLAIKEYIFWKHAQKLFVALHKKESHKVQYTLLLWRYMIGWFLVDD